MGLEMSAAVISTVCYDAPPKPREIPLLQSGLERLAAWYKMGKQACLQEKVKKQ